MNKKNLVLKVKQKERTRKNKKILYLKNSLNKYYIIIMKIKNIILKNIKKHQNLFNIRLIIK